MSEAREIKKQKIEEIKAKIEKCNSFVVVDFKGLSVIDDTAMRAKFRAENVEYCVLKNRLVSKALAELAMDGYDKYLEGTNAIAFANGDALAPAKIVTEAAKTIKAIEVRCGMMDKKLVDSATVSKLASIPPKEVLLAQLLGMLQSPLSGLARALQQVAEKNA
ncbi:MAG: 50S ribosomal protein L10 [Clostridia bacterium]